MGRSKKSDLSLPDWSYVIAGLDPAISPAQGIPASERGNDIVSYKSKLELIRDNKDYGLHEQLDSKGYPKAISGGSEFSAACFRHGFHSGSKRFFTTLVIVDSPPL